RLPRRRGAVPDHRRLTAVGERAHRPPDSGRSGDWTRVALRVLVGFACGLLGGGAVLLGLLAYGAVVDGVYVHDWGNLVGWPGLPVVAGPVVMTALALRSRAARFWAGAAATIGVLLAGTVVGAVLGATLGSRPADAWAWSYMGAGGGIALLVGIRALAGIARRQGRRSRHGPMERANDAVLVAILAAAAAACGPDAEDVPSSPHVGPPVDSA